jgi:hypothetical protein
VDLTDEDVERGFRALPGGGRYEFTPEEVVRGVARLNYGADTFFVMDLLRRGEVAMLFFVCEPSLFQALDLPPEILGVWPVPPFERGRKPAMLAHYHFKTLSSPASERENRSLLW